jgi:hypothetical protein
MQTCDVLDALGIAVVKVSCWSCWRHAYTMSSVTEQYKPLDLPLLVRA